METRAHHVLIGVFTLVVVAAAMAFALWVGKSSLDREWQPYLIVFTESVTGLTVGGAVQYNGIQVGEVRRLSLDPNDPSRVLAEVRIGSEVPVKTDTEARLTFTGLTGVALIQLSGGSIEAPRLAVQGNGIPEIVAQQSAISALLSSSEDIASATSQVMVRINNLLSDENMRRVGATLDHLETISAAAAEGDDDIRTVLAKAAAASERLANLLDGAESVMQRIDQGIVRADQALSSEMPAIFERLQSALTSIERVGQQLDQLVTDNRASIDSFSRDGLSQVGPTLQEVKRLARDLDRLSRRLEQRPLDVVMGRSSLKEYPAQ
ncbi:MlaD family protein [Pseudomarimonas arenosa]|uniref:MCE family protein n=1 Tax=Pseudomarimonas arenosa TaxID=2774145 RepID=A0AAW3ZL88_9GAMM|nr:MlaD family protein [Pseudomarimonas arenosa]MBD8525442.1 MCE family protein [Pseudomarimonas arenosa]